MTENRRLRILFAAAEIAERKGYRAATIAEITERAGVERRSFDRVFADKQELLAAVHELTYEHVMAATAGAFFTEASWPERIWDAEVAFIQSIEQYPTLTHVGFVETHAAGPIAAQRLDELLLAFTFFLQEGYQCEPQGNPPSPLALEAIAATNFEIAYTLTRGIANSTMAGLLPHVTFMSLVPFLGPAEANRFIDQKLNVQPKGGS
jgi:AcrR family transcriptional regulator